MTAGRTENLAGCGFFKTGANSWSSLSLVVIFRTWSLNGPGKIMMMMMMMMMMMTMIMMMMMIIIIIIIISTRKTLNRFTKKDSYTWNIKHNTESTAVWSLKPERWRSQLIQEKYQEEKACDKRYNNNNNNNNNNKNKINPVRINIKVTGETTKASSLTFRHRASCILGQAFTTLQRTLFIYLINKYISLSDICLTVHHWYK